MSTSLPSLQCRVGRSDCFHITSKSTVEGVYRQVMEGGSAGTVVMWEGEVGGGEGG